MRSTQTAAGSLLLPLRKLLPPLALLAASCTSAGLQPERKMGNGPADDKLEIQAHVCTSPALDSFFPVKILFIIDTSDSMSVTDRGQVRAQAVAQVLNRFAGNPAVEFAVIAFDSEIDVLTPGFTNTPDIAKITTRLSQADKLTDYGGALGAAYTLVSQDILATNAADRARTKYVIMFMSDGTPDPQCSAQVTPCDQGKSTCQPHTECKPSNVAAGSACQPDYLICTIPKENWMMAFNPPLDPSLYPDLMAGADYNQPAQILKQVDDIIALQDFYRVGEIRMHTGFLFDPAAASDPLAAPFGLDRPSGVAILSQMAMHGGGTFTEFMSGTQINFLNLNYTSIKEDNALSFFFADNTNATPTSTGLVVDSDGDGLLDPDEQTAMTCVGKGTQTCNAPKDSDGDGYSDLLEARSRAAGMDPKDPMKPAQKCNARGDADGDGLADCEELFLKTDPRLPDSDGDRMTDFIELLYGLNPLDATDAAADPDRDGVRNLDEIRFHSDPNSPPKADDTEPHYLYDVAKPTQMANGQICYDLTVRDVRLVTTGKTADGQVLGKNRIMVYFNEAPADRPLDFGQLRAACIDTRYIDGAVKAPPNGVVTLADTDFIKLANLKPDQDCIDKTSLVLPPDGGSDM